MLGTTTCLAVVRILDQLMQQSQQPTGVLVKLGMPSKRGGTNKITSASIVVVLLPRDCWPAAEGGVTACSDGAWDTGELEGTNKTQVGSGKISSGGS